MGRGGDRGRKSFANNVASAQHAFQGSNLLGRNILIHTQPAQGLKRGQWGQVSHRRMPNIELLQYHPLACQWAKVGDVSPLQVQYLEFGKTGQRS